MVNVISTKKKRESPMNVVGRDSLRAVFQSLVRMLALGIQSLQCRHKNLLFDHRAGRHF